MPVLEVRDLTRRYGSFLAVDRVSFAIEEGDILGYLGPNGSGKSTTVKMLTGLIEPTSGEILFRGRPAHEDLTAYKRAIGYVPEEAQLYGFLTGWEYLEMVAVSARFGAWPFSPAKPQRSSKPSRSIRTATPRSRLIQKACASASPSSARPCMTRTC